MIGCKKVVMSNDPWLLCICNLLPQYFFSSHTSCSVSWNDFSTFLVASLLCCFAFPDIYLGLEDFLHLQHDKFLSRATVIHFVSFERLHNHLSNICLQVARTSSCLQVMSGSQASRGAEGSKMMRSCVSDGHLCRPSRAWLTQATNATQLAVQPCWLHGQVEVGQQVPSNDKSMMHCGIVTNKT